MNLNIIKKTYDVNVSQDVLRILKSESLFYLRGCNILEYLTCDIELLEQRSAIFNDTFKIKGLKSVIEQAAECLDHISEMIKLQCNIDERERSLYSIKQFQLYFEVVDLLSNFYKNNKGYFTSIDYINFFENTVVLSADREYVLLKKKSEKLVQKISNVKSVTVAFNLDESLSPQDAGIISVNNYRISSASLVERILGGDEKFSLAPIVPPRRLCTESEYNVLNFSLYMSLKKIFTKALKQWEPEVCKYLQKHMDGLLNCLNDLKFILNIVNIIERMTKAGLKLSKPIYYPMTKKKFAAAGLYNPVLAINYAENTPGKQIVKNDISFDNEAGIYVMTGANSGGKSVFLCAVALTQIMAQIGMLVPADKLEISPVSSLFVVLPKNDLLNQDGRLAEECKAIQTIFRGINEYSILFFDELFSSTDPIESVILSSEVLKAMSVARIRGIYSTHFHALIEEAKKINCNNVANIKIDFLVADIINGEKRTYKIRRQKPDGQSYALSIANQYGICCEKLLGELNSV